MDKFATALRLRWPWLEWKNNTKIWAGTDNPCTDNDMEIFYAATTITGPWQRPQNSLLACPMASKNDVQRHQANFF
jgi:hypothetical protein